MNPRVMHHRWSRIAAVVAGWAFLGLVLSVEVYFSFRGQHGAHQFSVFDAVLTQFVRVTMWALMAPLILQLQEKVPLRRGRWFGGIGFHVAMSFAVMAVYYLGRMMAFQLFDDEPWTDFWGMAAKAFLGRNLIDMAYYWGVIAFGHSVEIYRQFKREELKAAQLEARLVETELKTLREQLRPHFLFNTLNTIAVLVRENKNDEAVTLIARLSTLLRTSLDRTRGHEVTVRQEMEFLEGYVEIQRARFSDRLQFGLAIEPAAMEARIPNLLLQPLVENAILHGIAPKAGPGRVDVIARVEAGRLHLEVRDDGPGLTGGTPGAREGIGLSNTRERLAKIYGAHGQFSLSGEPGRGVSVRIVIPLHT